MSIGLGGKIILGRVELVDFPRFDLHGIEARVDTGALTSSIHCSDVCVLDQHDDGTSSISFTLLDPEHPEWNGKTFKTTSVGIRTVRSSNGETQERHVIETDILLAGRAISTQFTLASRESMTYPVLLGRRVLRNEFLVDVAMRRTTSELTEEE